MKRRTFLPVMAGGLLVSACATTPPSKFKTYTGPQVTNLIIKKSSRSLYLMQDDKVLKKYRIDLGFAPVGHKQFEGDGKTPEGRYIIDKRNPNSAYHLSIGLSYPNKADIAYAKSIGKDPGGDIFIHGGPTLRRDRYKRDWTAGCISISDREIEDVYAMVKNGTPIDVFA
jgi:murein L,D-transpeptidase YafK